MSSTFFENEGFTITELAFKVYIDKSFFVPPNYTLTNQSSDIKYSVIQSKEALAVNVLRRRINC